MSKSGSGDLQFQGFLSPRYTQVPDELFDELMAHLSGAELKVLLYIIRRTFGFKKDSDTISLNQICKGITTKKGEVLDRGTGLSQNAVLSALKGLIAKKAIVAKRNSSPEKGHEPTTYSLNIIPFLNNLRPPSAKIEEALPQKLRTQHTVIQQTELQHRISISKSSHNGSHNNKTTTTFQTIGELMSPQAQTSGTGITALTEAVTAAVREISAEFGEPRCTRSNLTHVARIIERSGKSLQSFSSYLYEARSITRQQKAVKKRMPYFFRVLEDIVGVGS
jgi:phage replication O-like protein O